MKLFSTLLVILSTCFVCALAGAQTQASAYEVEQLTIGGGADAKGGRIVIEATLGGPIGDGPEAKLIYALQTDSVVHVTAGSIQQSTRLKVQVKSGKLDRLEFDVTDGLPIETVRGDAIRSWSLQRSVEADSKGSGAELRLVLELKEPMESGEIACVVEARQTGLKLPGKGAAVFFSPPDADLHTGTIRVEWDAGLLVAAHTEQSLASVGTNAAKNVLAYTYSKGGQQLAFDITSRIQPDVMFHDFALSGEYEANRFRFELEGVVEVMHPGEFELPLLTGGAALSTAPEIGGARVFYRSGGYHVHFHAPGRYPVALKFDAKVETMAGQSSVAFDLVDSALQPVRLTGIPVGADRIRLNGVLMQAQGNSVAGNLPGNGRFRLVWTDPSWKSPEPEDAALFYAAESVSQIEIGPGFLRQNSEFAIRIMQGSMRTLMFEIEGEGDITQVEGDSILRWDVGPSELAPGNRSLVLELNKAYDDDFSIQVRSQHAMSAFPSEARPLRVLPVDAIRYGGFIRITNLGAVSIDVPESTGFAQISPEYFPAVKGPEASGSQVLAYRFSDVNYTYVVRADDILPEVAVSQILIYRIGMEDQSLQAELELTIRKASLRDFYIRIPEGYAVSDIRVRSLADYFLLDDAAGRQLRIVFSDPLSGKQVIQLSLENNSELEAADWTLPQFWPEGVKNIRGHIGVVAEPGLRVTLGPVRGLIEQAPNFFPKTVEALQVALRLREADWTAQIAVEKLPQAIQADVLHLYTVGEGRIYGSSVINYVVSGAPVSDFRIQMPSGMENIDFVGRDIRGWTPLGEGLYEVRLHAPAAGAYTLLCSYESGFDSKGETVTFSGVIPVGVTSEQGFVVVVSNFPFSLGEVRYASDLIRLEANEIPAEFRLLYDAQVLAAFQYTHRPMEISMGLKSFDQAEAKDQVIDFAELKSHISRDGQVLTSVALMLKSKGQTHFRMQLPPEHRIWSARVEGQKVNPISVEGGILLPLPVGQSPDSALRVNLELAAESARAERPVVYAPAMYAPSLIMTWTLTSDPDFGLGYVGGDITSADMYGQSRGFDWLAMVTRGGHAEMRAVFIIMIAMGIVALFFARALGRWSADFRRFTKSVLILAIVGLVGGLTVCGIILGAVTLPESGLSDSIELKAPIELSTEPLRLELVNRAYDSAGAGVGSVALFPVLAGAVLWGLALLGKGDRNVLWAAGWLCIFLGALSAVNGGAFFITVFVLFFLVHILRPFAHTVSRRSASLALTVGLIGWGAMWPGHEAEARRPATTEQTMTTAESPVAARQLAERVTVDGDIARVESTLEWAADAGERYTFLRAPATLTGSGPLPEGLRLFQTRVGDAVHYVVEAVQAGEYTFEFEYRTPVVPEASGGALLRLPVGLALSHQAEITIPFSKVALESKQAVSISPAAGGAGISVYNVVFQPSTDTQLAWSPVRRDASKETAVYYVESFDVFTPLVGLISGHHVLNVRLSQGQIDALQVAIPVGMTITAVEAEHLASWQFDPGERRLMLYFAPVRQGQFEVRVFSQYTSSGLPYERTVRPPQVLGAAGQLSLVALATDEEVQIGSITESAATVINLEDFPLKHIEALAHLGRVPQLRRAYRWEAGAGALTLQALAVEPDIRTVAKQTVSMGEDRVLIAWELKAEINRAGVFRLSLPIPADHDVESVSGQHLSHWNETVEVDGVRRLQLHLRGKTEGATTLHVSLSGPGLSGQSRYMPPLLQLTETDRQTGTLVLVPELGYRLQATERSAAVQVDPAQAGMQRKDVLLYRILNKDARLGFDVERVDPWVEVDRVQAVTVRSGVVEVKARFRFSVENAGIREQRVRLPEGAIGVQFSGEALADYQESSEGEWLLKLNRKMVGAFVIELSYQLPTPNQPDRITVVDAEVRSVNQQSGYLTLAAQGRIQLQPQAGPAGLQPAEAHMIEARLRGDLPVGEASHVYRILEPGFSIGLQVKRHQIADSVPAQVRDVKLASILSGSGGMLTQVTLKLDPGDKRMLRITLPANSEFWFGSINQQSVWPWREGGDILLQMEANPVSGEDSVIEFFYATHSVVKDQSKLKASLRGPKLDLPLENIVWTLYYPETWEVEKWSGNLSPDARGVGRTSITDLSDYLQSEQRNRMLKKSKAENLLTEANQLLEMGQQEQARKAFSSAYNLSQADNALNEDARVQLQNVREQQAFVALANRRNIFINENPQAHSVAPQVEIEQKRLLNYTDQIVQGVVSGNTEEDNRTLRILAARLIGQQQATPAHPQAIHTILPQEGRSATFSRSLQINDQADLVIDLSGKRRSGGPSLPWGSLFLLAALVVGVGYGTRRSN